MTEQLVAIAELADELGTYRSTLFKIARRLRIEPRKQRDIDRGNQRVAVVTPEEAERIRTEYSARRVVGEQGSDDAGTVVADAGVFYVIQLEPALDPGRFKVGFSTDLDGRLRHHRCSAPLAQCRKSWPCRRTWEQAAIDCTSAGLERLSKEVFRGPSLDDVIERGDRFFGLMPPVQELPGTDDEVLPEEGNPC